MHKCFMAQILERPADPLRFLAVLARVADEEFARVPTLARSLVVIIQ